MSLRDALKERFSSWYEKNPNLYRRKIDPTPLSYIRWSIMLIALGYIWYERYKFFDFVRPYLYGPLSYAHYAMYEGIQLALRILPTGFLEMAMPSAIAWWIYTLTRKPGKGIMVGVFVSILYLAYSTQPIPIS
jgi:hypothetical protein